MIEGIVINSVKKPLPEVIKVDQQDRDDKSQNTFPSFPESNEATLIEFIKKNPMEFDAFTKSPKNLAVDLTTLDL